MTNLVELRRLDPLGMRIDLPLKETFYPGGFAIEISSNSSDVLGAAAEAWGRYAPAFDREPLRLRVMVHPDGELAEQPVHRMQGPVHAVISDRHNFASANLDSGFGFIYVSERTAADHTWLRWYFLESLTYVMLSHRSLVAIHAACVVRNGRGYLLCGPSCAGKTTLSYACARAGWTFVADDGTWLVVDSDYLMATGQPRHARFRTDAPRLFPELEAYAVRTRPNGKIGIEVPLAELPQLRTADRAEIAALIFLERGEDPAGAYRLTGEEAVDRLLADLPSFGEETDAIHERTVRRLHAAPAWRMRYRTLDEALNILEALPL